MFRNLSLKELENLQGLGVANLVQFFNGYSPFPLGIVFHLILRCNLRCKMCPQVGVRDKYGSTELFPD